MILYIIHNPFTDKYIYFLLFYLYEKLHRNKKIDRSTQLNVVGVCETISKNTEYICMPLTALKNTTALIKDKKSCAHRY